MGYDETIIDSENINNMKGLNRKSKIKQRYSIFVSFLLSIF